MSAIPAFIPRSSPMVGPTSNGEAGQVFTSDGAGGGDWQDVDAVAGTVNSVNGQTGEVVLDAADVGALPDHIPGTHTGPGVPVYASDGSVSSPAFGTAATVLLIDSLGSINWNRLDPSFIDGLGDLATLNEVEIEQVNNLQEVLDIEANTRSAADTSLAGGIAGVASDLTTHTGNTSNPHGVTKSQVGLGSVDNTSDANKPVSTATQTALDGKVPITRTITAGTGLTGGGDLSANRTIAADFGTGAGKVTEGNDSRLSDTRTPTDNTVSTAKIQADAVTYAKIQNVSATDKVLGRSTSGAGDVEEIACTAAGRAIIDDADAAAQRVTIGLATIVKDVFISSPADGTITITAKARFAGTINGIYGLKTSSGSLTMKVQIGGVDVTSLTGLSVTTSAQDVSATGANTFAVGDRITIVISSSSTPANLEFTMQATR